MRLLNQGLEPLTSCAIQVSRVLPFNQTEVVGTYDWEGNLDTYELADAALTTLDIDDLELLQLTSSPRTTTLKTTKCWANSIE